ncbi:MAG: RDD family protein [Bacteroidales bacterium]|nr:RDD family protein [Bacteroidales bacterium]MCF8457604.1 RDD family protein [Bacteroidales bacterium]
MTDQEYPGVSLRVKAIVTDGIVLVVCMILITYLFSLFENVPDAARIIAFLFVFFLYDPIFTSTFGGTIGHFAFGIQVKRESDQERNILFPYAIIRFIVKALLGWMSLLTVSNNEKGKAIHDMVVGSVVVYKE